MQRKPFYYNYTVLGLIMTNIAGAQRPYAHIYTPVRTAEIWKKGIVLNFLKALLSFNRMTYLLFRSIWVSLFEYFL